MEYIQTTNGKDILWDPECSSSIRDIRSYLNTVFDELKEQIEAYKKSKE